MEISTFLQQAFKNVWVIVVLSGLILIIGWILGGVIPAWVSRLLARAQFARILNGRLKLGPGEVGSRALQQVVRAAVLVAALWGAWRTIDSLPEISGRLALAWSAVAGFARQPPVVVAINVLLIGLGTFLLFKTFGWTKAGEASVARRIGSDKGQRLRGLGFQRVQILTASQLRKLLLGVSRFIRYAIDLLLILIYLTGVFSVFPGTRGFVTTVLTGILRAVSNGWHNFLNYLPNLINLALIILVAFYGLKVLRFLFKEVEKGTITLSGFHPEWAIPTYQLVRFVVIALALVVAFPYLPGSSSPAFQGVSVFIGILFSLGSTSLVSNIVAGIVLTYTRAFHVGDRVQIADTVGDVIEKSLLVTRVRTIKNVVITIPNGQVLAGHIVNYSSVTPGHALILNTSVTLGYDIPWRRIHAALIKAAAATDGILAEPPPYVLQTSLGDFYVSYELNATTDQPNQMAVIYSELHQNIQDSCNEAGIEILSPHYEALRDGNPSTIASEHLPKDYEAPAFEVKVRHDKNG